MPEAKHPGASPTGCSSPQPQTLIREIASTLELKREAIRQGMQTLRMAALGKLGEGRAFAPLTIALESPSSNLRAAAATGLGYLGDSRAVDSLIARLKASKCPSCIIP